MQRQHVDARDHADQEKGESRRRIEVGAEGMIHLGVARYTCVFFGSRVCRIALVFRFFFVRNTCCVVTWGLIREIRQV